MDVFTPGFSGLFLVTFLSATILPFSSELLLLFMLSKGYDPALCLIIATTGNSIGGLTNYGIGRLGNPKWLQKAGMNPEKLDRWEKSIQRYGSWLALLSWVPLIGDPLIVALGFFRTPFSKVTILLIIGKFVRYLIVISFYVYWK